MTKLEELKAKKEKYLLKVKEKRLLLGESDGAMQSQCPSGRFELEDEIKVLESSITQLQLEIDIMERHA